MWLRGGMTEGHIVKKDATSPPLWVRKEGFVVK